MRLSWKRIRIALLLGVLFGALILCGCVRQIRSADELSVKGAVYTVHRSDGSIKTYIDVGIGRRFKGRLPDDIDAITVAGPSGLLPIQKSDFNYNPQWRAFWGVRPGMPELGEYTFTVASGGKTGVATDVQSTVQALPIPDTGTFQPKSLGTVDCTPPLFSWEKPAHDARLYFQVEIRDQNRRHVYRTEYVPDMDFVRLPPDILMPDTTYQWRVRAADGPDWHALNNRSQSSWVTFTTTKQMGTCPYRYHPPPETGDGWEGSTLAEHGIDEKIIDRLMQEIFSNRLKKVHSVLMVKNGKLVLEEYFNGHHRNRIHPMRSFTKSVTSILFGIAKGQGKPVALEDRLFRLLPEYADIASDERKREITLEDLLTMRAGLAWCESMKPYSIPPMYKSTDSIRYVLEKKQIAPPGETYLYSSGVSTVLGKILQRITGTDADRFAAEHLFKPLGITDYRWHKLPDGNVTTGWGLDIRTRDMAKIGYLYLRNGMWKGRRIVPQSWVSASLSRHVKGEFTVGSDYGYQWRWCKLPVGGRKVSAFLAAGHGGQYMFAVPDLDLVAAFTNQADHNIGGDFRALGMMENYILPAVLHPPPSPDTPGIAPGTYSRFAGKYRSAKTGVTMKIFTENGRLYGKSILIEDLFRLLPMGAHRFAGLSDDMGRFRLTFVVNPGSGRITGADLSIGCSRLQFHRTRPLFFGR